MDDYDAMILVLMQWFSLCSRKIEDRTGVTILVDDTTKVDELICE
jgi:hypothetical protein